MELCIFQFRRRLLSELVETMLIMIMNELCLTAFHQAYQISDGNGSIGGTLRVGSTH